MRIKKRCNCANLKCTMNDNLLPFFSSAFESKSDKYLPRQIYINIATRRPAFPCRHYLLKKKNGQEPDGELDLVVRGELCHHTLNTIWAAFECTFSLKQSHFFSSQLLKLHLNSADMFANI